MKKITQLKNNAGFTLIEVIVIVAILAILAGVLVPMIFSQIDEAKIARAESDCKSISSATLTFRKDLGVWPIGCGTTATLLRGQGNLPAGLAALSFDTTTTKYFKNILMLDDDECYNTSLYKGPYLPIVEADPWGNAYLLAADMFSNTNAPVFVYSAGPNGTIETSAGGLSPLGDDIGIRIK